MVSNTINIRIKNKQLMFSCFPHLSAGDRIRDTPSIAQQNNIFFIKIYDSLHLKQGVNNPIIVAPYEKARIFNIFNPK